MREMSARVIGDGVNTGHEPNNNLHGAALHWAHRGDAVDGHEDARRREQRGFHHSMEQRVPKYCLRHSGGYCSVLLSTDVDGVTLLVPASSKLLAPDCQGATLTRIEQVNDTQLPPHPSTTRLLARLLTRLLARLLTAAT